jgi:cytochrome c5
MLKHWIAGLMCLALAACGGSSDDSDATGGTSGAGGEHDHHSAACGESGLDFASGEAAAGAEIYSAFCASCHGADGTGNSGAPTASSRGVDLHEHVAEGMTGDCWVDIIKNGEGEMAAVAGVTDDQIVDLLAYMNANFAH